MEKRQRGTTGERFGSKDLSMHPSKLPWLVLTLCIWVIGCFSVWAVEVDYRIQTDSQLTYLIDQLTASNITLKKNESQQSEHLQYIIQEKNRIYKQIKEVKNTLGLLEEQGKWLSYSTALGETLRRQLTNLPEKPKTRPLDQYIADIRVELINYHEQKRDTDALPKIAPTLKKTHSGQIYTHLIEERVRLLNRLSAHGDTLVLELTKVKIANERLIKAIDDVNSAAHRYFFWVADINPINKHYPAELLRDLTHVIFSVDLVQQLSGAMQLIFTTPTTFILLTFSLIFVVLHFRFKKRFLSFLARKAQRVGKVTQDNFSLTLKVVFYSLFMALPLPILWAVMGYSLQISWDYPFAVALGSGMNAVVPILWVCMISAYFAMPNGLFTGHLKWPVKGVKAAMKYYSLSLWVVIPLVMILITFDSYNNREFASTLSRFSFILLSFALIFMTNSLHRAGLPLYIDKKGSGDNLLSRGLWLVLLSAPWIAIASACLGYLFTAEVLLGRLEASVVIWFGLLAIYFLTRRWMLIQKRRIEFERAKQKRQERLAHRQKFGNEDEINNDIMEESVIDLDVISSQSLQLVRSILMMIALISMIVLWSELHSAFAFMDNIKLWTTKMAAPNGIEIDQSITLGSFFIAAIIMTLTIQLLKNLPALLELGVLHHLDLAPGTGYAISTVSKYITLMIGSAIACSFIGIDWAKVQWLIAALGLGLGFGLQEIFANFISGLIILFEKPVRIGDTVTIRNLTGSVAKINTRATTIVDWDHKEIIMPNKAFVTEQFINWSLSNSITRIVLTVPATIDANPDLIIRLIKNATRMCSYVLNEPEAQVFLVDIQEGIQLFEVRVFASEIGHRMPIRSEMQQLIIQEYRQHGLELPFPPLQTHLGTFGRVSGRRVFASGEI